MTIYFLISYCAQFCVIPSKISPSNVTRVPGVVALKPHPLSLTRVNVHVVPIHP